MNIQRCVSGKNQRSTRIEIPATSIISETIAVELPTAEPSVQRLCCRIVRFFVRLFPAIMYAPALLFVSPSGPAGVRARAGHPAQPSVRRTAQTPLALARRLI
ncbi:hypothetical protein EHZ18_07710 [Burkholderia vietnamiensis]|nr:hypothetical protein EHZ18_07710 [Burkholderia vietnamiensis]